MTSDLSNHCGASDGELAHERATSKSCPDCGGGLSTGGHHIEHTSRNASFLGELRREQMTICASLLPLVTPRTSLPLSLPACLPPSLPPSQPTTARAKAEKGVSSDGFKTTLQPAARAAPALRVTMAMGKFQGVMRAATPTGCLATSVLLPLTCGERRSPSILLASSENHSRKEAP